MRDEKVGEWARNVRRREMWLDLPKDKDERTRLLKRHADFDLAMAGGLEMYAAPQRDWLGKRPAILPFGREYAKWSVYDVENHHFGQKWLGNMYAIICRRLDESRTRPTRLIWSSGLPPSEKDRIGLSFDAHHDQTGKKLGEYEIVGIVVYDPDGFVGRVIGDVPSVKLSQSTYK